MDPLSISASIVALVQLTGMVIEYLHGVKGASEDRQNILSELTSVSSMLFILQDRVDQQEDSWPLTLKLLNGSEGLLAQLRTSLGILLSKLSPVKGLKKGEIKEILNIIERQKALLTLARQNDHIALSTAIKDGVQTLIRKVDDISKDKAYMQMRE
ncbi:MAG: hypothetical protein Q9161_000656 [Pseudevernia consocians]